MADKLFLHLSPFTSSEHRAGAGSSGEQAAAQRHAVQRRQTVVWVFWPQLNLKAQEGQAVTCAQILHQLEWRMA